MVPLLRRRLVERVGLFDTSFSAAEDWDYWYRCAQHTPFLYLPGKSSVYRLHGSQMSRDYDRMTKANMQFAEKHFSSDVKKRRANLAFFYLRRAKREKNERKYWRCFKDVFNYFANIRSLSQAKFIWEMA
jgi:hypothetical protein